jgi:hypothetical protein
MSWTIAYHEAAVTNWPGNLRISAPSSTIVALIGAFSLERLSPKYKLHLQVEIWEFRMKGKDGIARAHYVTAKGKRIVVARVFTKKTQKSPRNEFKVALKRAMEVT